MVLEISIVRQMVSDWLSGRETVSAQTVGRTGGAGIRVWLKGGDISYNGRIPGIQPGINPNPVRPARRQALYHEGG